MQTGRMNNPAGELAREIAHAAELGFDYLELTVEPPCAASDTLDAAQVRAWLLDAGLGVVGHTAYYLPIASPFARVRQAAVDQLRADCDFLAAVGCDRVTIHPDRAIALGYSAEERLRRQVDSFHQLIEHALPLRLRVMYENLSGFVGDPDLLRRLVFDPLPELALTLDIAHAALGVDVSRTGRFLKLLGDRLSHVHISDNNGQLDQHQPLGSVGLPLRETLHQLRATGYHAGITLEVFVPELEYQRVSLDLLHRWWDETP